ncbi:hypothetical protein BC628DRAFT_1394472 [Trametes gibbosa]|nr:hypothetical protein BC628DRAFT_1394472 [Trametes gibbosa]
MTMLSLTNQASLQSLPDELLEKVLIACAENDDVESVAAVAATSRRLYRIIYISSDHHLWRSLFLALFDDPRHVRYRLLPGIDWKSDLQSRVWFRRLISHHYRAPPPLARRTIDLRSRPVTVRLPAANHPLSVDVSTYLLRGAVSAIHTAAPQPPLIRLRSEEAGQVSLPHSHPETLGDLHSRTGVWPEAPHPRCPSMNIAWLGKNIPRDLHARLTAVFKPTNPDRNWHASPNDLALAQLISYLGSHHDPDVVSPRETSVANEIVQDPWSTGSDLVLCEDKRPLHVALPRVFNLGYLSRRRGWGPYLPIPVLCTTGHSTRDSPDYDSDSDPDDPDWSPNDVSETHVSYTAPPERLLPDWSWLSAARIVADHTLRQHNSLEDVQKLQAWDNLREGTWVRPPTGQTSATRPNSRSALSVPAEVKELPEYDWAGVEGIWRRLVIWLGYVNLLHHYQHGHYDDPDLAREWVIVPLSLHITGYSPAHVVKYADKPTIHVEGQMGGEYWKGNIDDDDDDVRRVHGTVSMLADGSVRWSITSLNQDNTRDHWASEAVQLGGVGSAMGSLGLWTGGQHEEEDPLGVIWQWRVG